MNDATGRNTARRRRADTIARCERIMETARRLPLTRDVLAEAIGQATPVQLDLMERWLDAEIASRERSKRIRLLKAAGFPNAKDIEGYDWSNLRMPADWGRAQIEALDFIDRLCFDAPIHCQAFGCVVLGWLSSVSTGWPVARVREGRVRRVRSR